MSEKAVIDRFEEEWAVLLVGEEQQQLIVPRQSLPPEAKEGHWLRVEVEGDKLLSAVIDLEETDRVSQRIAAKRARLRWGFLGRLFWPPKEDARDDE